MSMIDLDTKRKLTIGIMPNHPGLVLPPPPSHSVARVIENQILGLKKLGHRVVLLGPESSKIECEVIPLCKNPISLEDDPSLFLANQVFEGAQQILRENKYGIDIVNGHSVDIPGVLHTAGHLGDCPIPHVTTLHSCIEISNLDYFKTCKNPIVSLSLNQQKACPTLNFVGTVYNGLNPEEFPIVTHPDNYICFLGRMSKIKQPHLAIQLALQTGAPLKLAGPIAPFDKIYFENECAPLLKNNNIEYLGELGMDDKIRLLAHAKCNIHPTGFRDPCPLVPIEAGYCGTPTLAINRGSLGELVENGVSGYLVEDYAEGAFLLDPCFRLDRAAVASHVRSKFNRDKMALQYEEVYKNLLVKELPY